MNLPLLLTPPQPPQQLELTTTCGPDDQLSSPKEMRWSAALGKLLVADANNIRLLVRNANLSYFSKSYKSCVAVDSDSTKCFTINVGGSFYKRDLDFTVISGPLTIPSPRMIDASGHADYVFVTSNNGTDGHGVRMVKKSTMAVVASMLATGTGDSQFTNPLGLFYVAATKKLYICEATRICVLDVTDTPGAEALAWSTSYAIAALDLTWDGTNFYVQTATQTIKYDSVFTDGTKVTASVVGYSITLIPNQGDGADGTNPTLGIVDNTNSHIERRKTSDLTQINSVGSSGDGTSSKCDPTITTAQNTRVTFSAPDANWSYTTALGTTHAIAWNGFDGFSWASQPPHKMLIRVEGGLGLVTAIDGNTDAVTQIKNLNRLTNATSIILNTNAALSGNFGDISNKNLIVTLKLNGTLYTLPVDFITYLKSIQTLQVNDLGLSQVSVDAIIDAIYQAVLIDPNHFSNTPTMNIGTNNAAPSGVYQVATPPTTGLEKVYYLCHLGAHAWTITWNGGSGP